MIVLWTIVIALLLTSPRFWKALTVLFAIGCMLDQFQFYSTSNRFIFFCYQYVSDLFFKRSDLIFCLVILPADYNAGHFHDHSGALEYKGLHHLRLLICKLPYLAHRFAIIFFVYLSGDVAWLHFFCADRQIKSACN